MKYYPNKVYLKDDIQMHKKEETPTLSLGHVVSLFYQKRNDTLGSLNIGE